MAVNCPLRLRPSAVSVGLSNLLISEQTVQLSALLFALTVWACLVVVAALRVSNQIFREAEIVGLRKPPHVHLLVYRLVMRLPVVVNCSFLPRWLASLSGDLKENNIRLLNLESGMMRAFRASAEIKICVV